MVGTSRVVSTVEVVVAEFREKNVTFLAGSIAYNAFLSLVPLLLFSMLVFAFLGGRRSRAVVAFVTENVSPTVGLLIVRIFNSRVSSTTGSSLAGLAVLVWGSLKLFRGLDTAFSQIYEADGEKALADQVVDGAVVLGCLVLALGATIGATTTFAAFQRRLPLLGVVLPLVLVVGLAVAFYPMYYVFPDVDVSAREIVPGVVVAAVGWALLQSVFEIYVSTAVADGGTGLVTGIMVLLTWLYFSGVVVLLGVVVNAVLGGYTDRSGETTA